MAEITEIFILKMKESEELDTIREAFLGYIDEMIVGQYFKQYVSKT
jgi:hypothetical protein